MRIEFVRSGGPAAFPGMVMDATIDLAANPGRVSEKGGYTRDLPSQEAQEVQKLIDPVLFFRIDTKDLAKKREAGPRDLYQYDIAVHLEDGRTHSITVSDMMGDTLESLSPGLGKFLDWAKQECQRITSYKMSDKAGRR